jgi:hypothetical protein
MMTEMSKSEQDRMIAQFMASQQEDAADKARAARSVQVGKKLHEDDWDPELFIVDMYEDFLRAGQQSKIGLGSTFEGWLRKSLEQLEFRKTELESECHFALIDGKTANFGKDLADRAIEAIRHYLELPDNMRLIGV